MADLRKLKDEAAAAGTKGKYKKAAELYGQIGAVEKDEPAWPHRAGEALRRAGQPKEAVEQLGRAAEGYAKQGFLLKAISVAKMIVEIDPGRDESQHMLAALYARRDSTPHGSPGQYPQYQVIPGLSRPAMAPPESAHGSSLASHPSPSLSSQPALSSQEGIALPLDIPLADEHDGSGNVERASHPVTPPVRPETRSVVPPPLPPGARKPPAPPLLQSTPGTIELMGIDEHVGSAASPPPIPLAVERPMVPRTPTRTPTIDRLPLNEVIPGARVTGQFNVNAFEIPLPSTQDLTRTVNEISAAGVSAAPPPLPKIPLFSSLSEPSLRHLIEHARVVIKAPGETVLRQGDDGDALFVIVRGEVDISAEGITRPIAHLNEGAFFGELAVLTDQPRLATVTAVGEVELLEISRETIWELIEAAPEVLGVMLRFFRDRLVDRLISTAPLFAPFSGGDSRQLAERFQFLEMKPGTVLVQQGQRADGLFIVLAGKCDVDMEGHGHLAEIGPGEVIGEISLLTRGPSVATARARTRVWVLALPRADFQETILTHPQVLEYVSEIADARRTAVENRIRMV